MHYLAGQRHRRLQGDFIFRINILAGPAPDPGQQAAGLVHGGRARLEKLDHIRRQQSAGQGYEVHVDTVMVHPMVRFPLLLMSNVANFIVFFLSSS